MLKPNLRFRLGLVFVLGLSLLCLGVSVRADDDRGDNHRNQRDNHNSQRDRYHYREGHWYGHGDVVVSDVPVGSEIESLPPQYKTIVIGNNSYYYDNTRYYSRSPDGDYVVVERPSAPLVQIKF